MEIDVIHDLKKNTVSIKTENIKLMGRLTFNKWNRPLIDVAQLGEHNHGLLLIYDRKGYNVTSLVIGTIQLALVVFYLKKPITTTYTKNIKQRACINCIFRVYDDDTIDTTSLAVIRRNSRYIPRHLCSVSQEYIDDFMVTRNMILQQKMSAIKRDVERELRDNRCEAHIFIPSNGKNEIEFNRLINPKSVEINRENKTITCRSRNEIIFVKYIVK